MTVIDTVFERKGFRDFVAHWAQEHGMALRSVEETVRSYLKSIATDPKDSVISFWDAGLNFLLPRLYEGIDLDRGSLDRFRGQIGRQPIIFACNRRSRLDTLLLSYLLCREGIALPLVCAGSNLSFWPLGPLLRKSGAFFIRRSFEANRLYAHTVRLYLEEILRENGIIELFIEGTRSRTGKLLPPRLGILKAIVEAGAQQEGCEPLIIPTSFTHEKGRRRGKIYVRFGSPIPARPPVEKLASETTYGINRSAVATSHSLVAMALLGHSSRALARDQIVRRIDRYLEYLRFKGVELSEPLSRSSPKAVDEALAQMVRSRWVEASDDEGAPLFSVPNGRRPLLDYYKNASLHFMVSLASLATLLTTAPDRVLPLAWVEKEYRFLQELLRHEFTFSGRLPLDQHLARLYDFIEKKEWVRREGDRLEILFATEEGPPLFSALLSNFFESCAVVWWSLPTLGIRKWEERELVRWLAYRARIHYLKGEINMPESGLEPPLKNALLAFRDLGLLRRESEGWGRSAQVRYQVERIDDAVGGRLVRLVKKGDHG